MHGVHWAIEKRVRTVRSTRTYEYVLASTVNLIYLYCRRTRIHRMRDLSYSIIVVSVSTVVQLYPVVRTGTYVPVLQINVNGT